MVKEKIFIVCPAGATSGGPEALHALCHELIDVGIQAAMFYIGSTDGSTDTPERFRHYRVPFVTTLDDETGIYLIFPETETRYMRDYPLARKAIWWLSVDNFTPRIAYFGPKSLHDWLMKCIFRFRNFSDSSIAHFCQSYYALDFVKRKGVRHAALLMDYLREDHAAATMCSSGREDIVLYNPAKGREFTECLIAASPSHIRFVALQGMTPAQVHDWCLRAKVYIDFGNHPGKDRFPREAVTAGCLVITSLRGSAAFDEDVPIPASYKFQDKREKIQEIITRIVSCIEHYSKHFPDFERYRKIVLNDRTKFSEQVRSIFVEGT